MKEIESNLNRQLEHISNLVNTLVKNENFSQIDIDILLEKLRHFYQDIYDLNRVKPLFSNKEKVSQPEEYGFVANNHIQQIKEEVNIEISDGQEEIENSQQISEQEEVNKSFAPEMVVENEKDETEIRIEEPETPIEQIQQISAKEEISESFAPEMVVENEKDETEIRIEEPETPIEQIQQIPAKEEISESFAPEMLVEDKNDETEIRIEEPETPIEQTSQSSVPKENQIDFPEKKEVFAQKETAKPEMSPIGTNNNGQMNPSPASHKDETRQPSLFEYLQSNNMEQISQNVSKLIETQKQDQGLTIGDTFKQEKPSVIEKIAPQTSSYSVEEKIQKQAILDYRDIIGINEKFLFINDLFSGNMKDYTDFIMLLNASNGKEEVEYFLQEMKNQRGWQDTSHAYVTLLQIIKRKF